MSSTSSRLFPRSGHVLGQSLVPEYGYFDHFMSGTAAEDGGKFSTTANKGEWLATVTGTGTIVISDAEEGGVATLANSGSAADSIEAQLNGEAFIVSTLTETWFECRLKLVDANDCKWFVGLAATDTTVLDGTNDSIGFRNAVGTTADIYTVVEDDTTETATDTTIDASDDTFFTVQFHIYKREYVEFAVLDNNGAVKYTSRVTTNIPDDNTALTLTMAVEATTATDGMEVDYIGCWGRKLAV